MFAGFDFMSAKKTIKPINDLTKEQLAVLNNKATEPAFSGKLLKEKRSGDYKCAFCGNKLFKSNAKFDSGTGWPSFCDAIEGSIQFEEDNSFGMKRTEVKCTKCGSHLGHFFTDGPKGKRYCINSLALDFKEKD